MQRWAGHTEAAQKEGHRLLGGVRKLARQIEVLAPAVDDGGRVPANCEYPWEDSRGTVYVPAEYKFSIDLLYAPAGLLLIKSLHAAIRQLAQ